jgi:ABC-type nitrate/sulfonate/bicarbonate transport system substrate-binding protein
VGRDLFAFMAADTRVLPTLVTLPEIRSYADLRGRTLTVDAMTTGYAFVLRGMLEHGGLRTEDYALESIGGAQQRYDDLLARRHAGCLLNSPLEGLLVAKGFHALDTAGNVVGRYQGQVGAARHAWVDAHPGLVSGFARAFLGAVAWLQQEANRNEAFAIFRANVAGADDGAAATAHRVLFDSANGMPADGRIDEEAVRNVIALRARFGAPYRQLGIPTDYYDLSYLRAASG